MSGNTLPVITIVLLPGTKSRYELPESKYELKSVSFPSESTMTTVPLIKSILIWLVESIDTVASSLKYSPVVVFVIVGADHPPGGEYRFISFGEKLIDLGLFITICEEYEL